MEGGGGRSLARIAFPRRGEVYWAELDPAVGSEIAKTRPALVVSNDIGNRYSPLLIAAPITSGGVDRVYPFEILVPAGEAGLERESKILLNQIRALDKRRLRGFLGSLSSERMLEVDRAIRLSLAV